MDQIVPELVSRDLKTHEVQGVDYSRLTALLIEAVKAQEAENPAVEATDQASPIQRVRPIADWIILFRSDGYTARLHIQEPRANEVFC